MAKKTFKRKFKDVKILCPGFPDCPDEPSDDIPGCKICPWKKNYKKGWINPTKKIIRR